MRRKIVLWSVLILLLVAIVAVPATIRWAKIGNREVTKITKETKEISLKKAKELFPAYSKRLREDKQYSIKFNLKTTYIGFFGKVRDTIGEPSLIETDIY